MRRRYSAVRLPWGLRVRSARTFCDHCFRFLSVSHTVRIVHFDRTGPAPADSDPRVTNPRTRRSIVTIPIAPGVHGNWPCWRGRCPFFPDGDQHGRVAARSVAMTKGRTLRMKLAVIALLFSAIGFATPKSLDLGGLVLSVSDAPTAQIFHIVDQLSQWDF